MSPRKNNDYLSIAVGVTVCLASFAATVLYIKRQQNQHTQCQTRGPCPPNFPEQLWHALHVSADRISSNHSLRSGDKLMLYALYKQATVGTAPPKRPTSESWNIVVEKAKYDAWCRMRGMTRQEAAIHYIQAAEELESEHGGDEAEEEALGAPVQSRPAVENGGYKDDENTPEAALLAAAGDCNVAKIKELLLAGVNVQHADETGQTAMHLAADKGSIESLTVLLENGGDIHAADQDGISVLQTAVIADNADVCRFLLQHGADADQQDGDGDTPRSCALDDGSSELRELFA